MPTKIYISWAANVWEVSWNAAIVISTHQELRNALHAAIDKVKSLPWGEINQIILVAEHRIEQILWDYDRDGFPPIFP